MERRVGYHRRNQPLTGRGPFYRTPWIRPTSTLVVNVEPLSDWPGSMCNNLVRWNQTSDPSCSCGASLQTMLHIVNDCPDMKFPGGLSALRLVEEEAIAWLGMQRTRYEEEYTGRNELK